VGAKLRVVVCLVELSVFLLYFFGGIFPSLLLNIMKRSSPASFEKKKDYNTFRFICKRAYRLIYLLDLTSLFILSFIYRELCYMQLKTLLLFSA